eukprot:m.146416 g.146416  ORF g.146416 m.146416 type:complete len:706 (+) comp30478_c0_seq3:456-2573(+)
MFLIRNIARLPKSINSIHVHRVNFRTTRTTSSSTSTYPYWSFANQLKMSDSTLPHATTPKHAQVQLPLQTNFEELTLTFEYDGKMLTVRRLLADNIENSMKRLALTLGKKHTPKPIKSKEANVKETKVKDNHQQQKLPSSNRPHPNKARMPFVCHLVDCDEKKLKQTPTTSNKEAFTTAKSLFITNVTTGSCQEFVLQKNLPKIIRIVSGESPMVGAVQRPVVEAQNCDKLSFEWFAQNKGVPQQQLLSTHASFTPTHELVGLALCIRITPHAADISGHMFEQVTSPVQPLPERSWPKLSVDTAIPDSFSVCSYNLLANLYAGNAKKTGELYPYCEPKYLHRHYRQQLIIAELTSIDSDIFCLQEVDKPFFSDYLQPALLSLGYTGKLMLKFNVAGPSQEGVAIFAKLSKFDFTSSQDLTMSATFKHGTHSDLFRLRNIDIQSLSKLLTHIGTVAQVSVLALKSSPDARHGDHTDVPTPTSTTSTTSTSTRVHTNTGERHVILVNTHLYYHPNASFIRAIHTAIIMKEVEHLMDVYPNAEVVFCGDLNSTPETPTIEFLLTGSLSSGHQCWKNASESFNNESVPTGEDEEPIVNGQRRGNLFPKWQFSTPPQEQDIPKEDKYGPHLHSDVELSSVLPISELSQHSSNYTADFCGWLDYILVSKGLTVVEVVPPLRESVLKEHIALPSKAFPSDHIPVVARLAFRS